MADCSCSECKSGWLGDDPYGGKPGCVQKIMANGMKEALANKVAINKGTKAQVRTDKHGLLWLPRCYSNSDCDHHKWGDKWGEVNEGAGIDDADARSVAHRKSFGTCSARYTGTDDFKVCTHWGDFLWKGKYCNSEGGLPHHCGPTYDGATIAESCDVNFGGFWQTCNETGGVRRY